MKFCYFILGLFLNVNLWADTIGQFMIVSENINRMEMKADSESQAWVRSARNVLLLTSESIWESLNIANQSAHLFCMPQDATMNAEAMTDLIKTKYQQIPGSDIDKNKLTVAQVGLMALQEKYPCKTMQSTSPQVTITHHGSSPVQKMVHIGKMGALM